MIKHLCSLLFIILFLVIACQPQEKQAEKEVVSSDSIRQDRLDEINKKWEGVWEREGTIDLATLTITNISETSFDFHITSHDGMKSGEFSGKASLEENMAVYISTLKEDTCNINFLLQDSLVVLTQVNGKCPETSGLDFSGEYFDERYFKEKTMSSEQ